MFNLKLMLIEDEEELRCTLEKILKREILEVHTFSSAVSALESYEQIQPDVILTDINMPDMDGLTMLKHIRDIDKDLPVIIISAFSDVDYFKKAIALHVYNYIVKPINIEILLDVLEKINNDKVHREGFLAQRKLLEEHKRIVDVSALVSETDLHGNIIYVNENFSKVSGYSKEELLGQPHSIVRHPDMPSSVFSNIWKTILNKKIWQGTIKNKNKNGHSYFVKTTIAPVLDLNNEIVKFISIREDITKLTKALEDSKRLEREKNEYLTLINENIITFSTDSRGLLTSVSNAFCHISQYSRKEIVDSYQMLKHIDISKEVARDIWKTLSKKGETWIGEIKYRAKDGSHYWLDARIFPIFDLNRKKIGYTLIGQDITDKKKVEKLSITDHLTGLYNRLKLDDILNYEIAQSARYATQFSLILVDIDHFKNVNDIYGHLEGDQVIKQISVILKSNGRESDTVGRWGGEEFLIILPHTGIKDAVQCAEKIRESIDTYVFPIVKNITSSFGLSEFKTGDTVQTLVSRADEALYRAKSMGRNRVEI